MKGPVPDGSRSEAIGALDRARSQPVASAQNLARAGGSTASTTMAAIAPVSVAV
jgi:hypothetical protein